MPPDTAPAARPCVLIVDDEPSIRRILHIKLTQSGIDPIEARDGEDAWTILPQVRPALVLLDIMMPKLDGLAFLRRVRESEEWRGLPVVVITAVRDIADHEGANALGAAAIIQKPFLISDVIETVRKFVPAPK